MAVEGSLNRPGAWLLQVFEVGDVGLEQRPQGLLRGSLGSFRFALLAALAIADGFFLLFLARNDGSTEIRLAGLVAAAEFVGFPAGTGKRQLEFAIVGLGPLTDG